MRCVIKFLAYMLFVLCVFSSGFAAYSAKHSYVTGNWQTIDDKTKKPSSVIHVQREGATYEGRIVKIYREDHQQSTDVCHACHGALKNKPILGLTIIKGMQCTAYECANGQILDPRSGKLYHARMALIDKGMRLKVRGYIGLPLFGQTVVWNRVSHI